MTGIEFDAAWAAGLLLAMIRVAAFVIASPFFPAAIPIPARAAVVIAISLFLATPVPDALDGPGLLLAAAANAALGFALGFLTGLVFQLFAVAGGVMDMTAALGAGAMIDPAMGVRASVLNRLFVFSGLALFYAVGGLGLLVQGLALSVDAVALDAAVAPPPELASVAVDLSRRMLLTGFEVALPGLAALFVVETALGLAARFAPQTNVFLLGLPLKLLVAIFVLGVVVLVFPTAIDAMQGVIRDTFRDVLAGMA